MRSGPHGRLVVVLVLVAVLAGGTFASIALAQDQGTSGQKIVFTIGSTGDLTTLNPLKVYQALEYYPLLWTYHLPMSFALTDLGTTDDFVTDVQMSDDAMTFTYTVRDDIKWSDGTPMTAEDMAYTLNLYQSAHAYIFSAYLSDMKSAEATDDTHVVLTTTQPTGLYATNYLYVPIVPKHVWDNLDVKPKAFENVPNVGSGPFIIAEYRPGEFFRMTRNPEWTGTQPQIDEIVWQYYKSEDALAESLKSGEIDFTYNLSPNIYNSLTGQENIDTIAGVVPSFSEISLNTGSAYYEAGDGYTPHGDGHPALADVTVRRAIRMAIDSDQLVERVYLGLATPGDTIVPPITIPGAKWVPEGADRLAWDIDGANAMLDDAGYEDCDGDGIREMPGCEQPSLQFRYFVRTSDQTTIDTAPFVQDWLEQIGIGADVRPVTSGRLGDIINAGEYDIFDWGWYPDVDPDSILGYFRCNQRPPDGQAYGNNDSYYCNPDYDALYAEQHSELDPARRLEILQQMQQLYYEDAAYIVKWYDPLLEAWRTDRFTGFEPQPTDPAGDLLTGYSRDVVLLIRPVAGSTSSGAETKGISPVIWLAIVGAIVLVVGAVVITRRRRISDEDVA